MESYTGLKKNNKAAKATRNIQTFYGIDYLNEIYKDGLKGFGKVRAQLTRTGRPVIFNYDLFLFEPNLIIGFKQKKNWKINLKI